MKTVGIIGGLGPETTAEFYLDIIFSCQKLSRTQRPPLVISSVPLPYNIEDDAIAKNTGIESVTISNYRSKKIREIWCRFLVMPCNSLHLFIKEIRESVSIPVLSIIEETVNFLKSKDYKKVGIISTSATVENKLYENAFKDADIDYVSPDDFQQAKMGKIIINLVTGQQRNEDREEIIRIIDSFDTKNVDCVALACTDLQLLIPKHESVPVFDTMKILADATVREILS